MSLLTHILVYRHANLPRRQQQEELQSILLCALFCLCLIASILIPAILRGEIIIEQND